MTERELVEPDVGEDVPDPDESVITNRKVSTQPYDLVVKSLNDQIKAKTIILRPSFQRGFVWPTKTSSRLIESIILNVPIPPCYFSQNEEFELDVIDGQQRLTSVYRFIQNQFALSGLEVCRELNGNRFHQLPTKIQRQVENHTIRCVVVTNDSHDAIKFDVFERLNTNTIPLNAQELRNCIYRGTLNTLLKDLAKTPDWLTILGRTNPDKRMRGEELILRFFSYQFFDPATYQSPQKQWLNKAAAFGRAFSEEQIDLLRTKFLDTIATCLTWFEPEECFRKQDTKAINRGIFDLVCFSASKISSKNAKSVRAEFRKRYFALLKKPTYIDVVSRSVDHTKRTRSRFEMWNEQMAGIGD